MGEIIDVAIIFIALTNLVKIYYLLHQIQQPPPQKKNFIIFHIVCAVFEGK